MEKDWPDLEACAAFRFGFMGAGLCRYRWEDDGFQFDFDRFYPRIAKELPWLRKLLESTRNKVRPNTEEDTENCPICQHSSYIGSGIPQYFDLNPGLPPDTWDPYLPANLKDIPILDMGKHPVWDMDPIPCPFHILDHLYGSPFFGSQWPALRTPHDLDRTKAYLKQLRESRGYSVECLPDSYLIGSGTRLKSCDRSTFPTIYPHISLCLRTCAIALINDKTDKEYELGEVCRVVTAGAGFMIYLVTFTAKPANSPNEDTFLATLDLHPSSSNPLIECFLQPQHTAPLPDPLPLRKMKKPKARRYWPIFKASSRFKN